MTEPTTPIYGWPYHSLIMPPDGADLGEDLALAIESTVSGLGTRLQQAEADINALEDPTDWTAFTTFPISSSGTPPTPGNSVYAAQYRVIDGNTVEYDYTVTIGNSGFAAGTGTYRIVLPVTPLIPAYAVGRIYVQDSGTAFLSGVTIHDSSSDTFMSIVLSNVTGGFIGATGPGTAWAANDKIQGSVRYRIL